DLAVEDDDVVHHRGHALDQDARLVLDGRCGRGRGLARRRLLARGLVVRARRSGEGDEDHRCQKPSHIQSLDRGGARAVAYCLGAGGRGAGTTVGRSPGSPGATGGGVEVSTRTLPSAASLISIFAFFFSPSTNSSIAFCRLSRYRRFWIWPFTSSYTFVIALRRPVCLRM